MRPYTPLPPFSHWVPESDPQIIALLGKAGEEAAELSNILFRSIIQGIDSSDPKTQKSNIHAIEEEIADVIAMCDILMNKLELDQEYISVRSSDRFKHKMARISSIKRS